jgi:RNA polymerase sigma-70 factor (ECF subfamily)
LLLHARSAARLTADGSLARLAEQDRRLWDPCLIAEGQAIVRASMGGLCCSNCVRVARRNRR